jgi:hypothetical protein
MLRKPVNSILTIPARNSSWARSMTSKVRCQRGAAFPQVATLNPRDGRAQDYLALNLEPMGDLDAAEQGTERTAGQSTGRTGDASGLQPALPGEA